MKKSPLSAFLVQLAMANALPQLLWDASDNSTSNATVAPACLTDDQASGIATSYVSLYNTGAVTSLSDLTSIIDPNFTGYDETATGPYSDGPATAGIEAFYESLTSGGNSSFTDAVQYPLFVMHDCSTIAYRWQFEGYSTGYNSTVPEGTYLEFEGNDIISVDLNTLLVTNATSSGDWINLARELGQIGTYFP